MVDKELADILFVGVDPGLYGAIAVIDGHRDVVLVEDFPIVKIPKTPVRRKRKDKKTGEEKMVTVQGYKREFDFPGVSILFARVAELPGKKICGLEAVSSMHGEGVVSVFTFGGAYWALRMALADHRLSYEYVPPKAWEKSLLTAMYKDTKERKDAYLARARAMFPNAELHLKKHSERAAALLIAEYVRRVFMGG